MQKCNAMNWRSRAIVLLAGLVLGVLTPGAAQGQGTAQVTISGVPPVLATPFIASIEQQYRQGQYVIQFTHTGSGTASFRFRFSIEKDGRTLVTSTSHPVEFAPGTYVYSRLDQGAPAVTFPNDMGDLIDQLPASTRRAVVRAGRLPEGSYSIYLEPIASDPMVVGVPGRASFQIIYPNPPTPITPMEAAEVTEAFPVFSWTLPTGVPAEAQLSYEVILVEARPGQTPLQALRANRVHARITLRNRTSFAYTPDLLPLEAGQRYVWQVKAQAELQGQALPFGDEGESEIYTFTVPESAMHVMSYTDGSQIRAPALQMTGRGSGRVVHTPVLQMTGAGSGAQVHAPALRMTGRGSGDAVQAPTLRMTGAGSGQVVQAPALRMTGKGSGQYVQAPTLRMSGRGGGQAIIAPALHMTGRGSAQNVRAPTLRMTGIGGGQSVRAPALHMRGRGNGATVRAPVLHMTGRRTSQTVQAPPLYMTGRGQ